MLGLKLPTDERWARLAEENLAGLLSDHAWCEQKAASNAISLIVHYPELDELVQTLSEIANEEMTHFKQVHRQITARGWKLEPERKDPYVNDLLKFVRKDKGRQVLLLDRLLFAAMIEARSCERFKLLFETVEDRTLAEFYRELMISEANHYTTFLKLARTYCPEHDVDSRWQAFLAYEAEVIGKYGVKETMHG